MIILMNHSKRWGKRTKRLLIIRSSKILVAKLVHWFWLRRIMLSKAIILKPEITNEKLLEIVYCNLFFYSLSPVIILKIPRLCNSEPLRWELKRRKKELVKSKFSSLQRLTNSYSAKCLAMCDLYDLANMPNMQFEHVAEKTFSTLWKKYFADMFRNLMCRGCRKRARIWNKTSRS